MHTMVLVQEITRPAACYIRYVAGMGGLDSSGPMDEVSLPPMLLNENMAACCLDCRNYLDLRLD